jgi:hypothetical protein
MDAAQPNKLVGKIFPFKLYGKKRPLKWSMHNHYFTKWPFLHWDDDSTAVFCLPCHNVHVLGMNIQARKGEGAFASTGFSSWKTAMTALISAARIITIAFRKQYAQWSCWLAAGEKKRQQSDSPAAREVTVSSLTFLGTQCMSIGGHTARVWQNSSSHHVQGCHS